MEASFLALHALGAFVRFPPEQLVKTYESLTLFLENESVGAVDRFDLYELHFYLLILTNHDVVAKTVLDRINDQFAGQLLQRIMILKLMYYEAIGDEKEAIKALGENPDELRASRRLATFGRNTSTAEYIKSLNYYLDLQPSDIVAWAELADQYAKVGHYDKAVFCLKDVLLQQPNAYNVFAKCGKYLYLQYLQALKEKTDRKDRLLAQLEILRHSRDCYLRSVELSESYVQGWIGVYVATDAPLVAKLESKHLETKFVDEAKRLGALARQKVIELEGLTEASFEEKSLLL